MSKEAAPQEVQEVLMRRALSKRLDAGAELAALYDAQEKARTVHPNPLNPIVRAASDTVPKAKEG